MRWTGDVAVGDWLKPLIDNPWRNTMHDVVPRGFEAYARVFHPASRDRPIERSGPHGSSHAGADHTENSTHPGENETEWQTVTWGETASALGTTMHPLAQWHALTGRTRTAQSVGHPRDAAGWSYNDPFEGELDPDTLSVVAEVLAQHTTTSDSGGVALWEGWGDLVGGVGYPSSATDARFDGNPLERGVDFFAHSSPDWFNNVFRRPSWQDGILSREVSEAPRLELPGRSFVVFDGGIGEFTSTDWQVRMPWRDFSAEERGFGLSAHSPSIIWPADHAWVLVSEIDDDSTIIAGSRALTDAVCATPGVEASVIPAGSRLDWDSDEVNR
jgi:hypothetical protein